MTKTFKPNRAGTVKDKKLLGYPLIASPKLDGIRAVVKNGVLLSRNLKPIPNKFLQSKFSIDEFEGFDGELIQGSPTSLSCYRDTVSAVMSHEGNPKTNFYVFDLSNQPLMGFSDRLQILYDQQKHLKTLDVKVVKHTLVKSLDELNKLEEKFILQGHEGVMLRSPLSKYKFGKSTFKEGGLLKLKVFEDSEAIIIGFQDQFKNTNEALKNELGAMSRSSKKEGMVAKGTLGALIVKGMRGKYRGVVFQVGTGFDEKLRQEIWDNRPRWAGEIIKYKYFPTGSKIAPRFPVYLGLRNKIDL